MAEPVQPTTKPLDDFKQRLVAFASGQRRGIRNPFVIVPVEPEAEQAVAAHLARWADGRGEEEGGATTLYLDRLMPRTRVFQTVLSLPGAFYDAVPASPDGHATGAARRVRLEAKTLQENLAREIVHLIDDAHHEVLGNPRHLVLLLHLGSLYPFARASELLDELDRLGAQATVGIPFPGRVISGKLSFFGDAAQHYYPAHRIDKVVTTDELKPYQS